LKENPSTGRWYTQEQVTNGRQLFAQYCSVCHGENAEATEQWKTPDSNGNYPPPPLNGSAHAWHHPLSVLDQVIRDGGEPVGGVMPAWGAVLNAQQRLDIIAGFQDYWSDEIYDIWLVRERSARGE
jgi:mono/diheme cytochrome c family protein